MAVRKPLTVHYRKFDDVVGAFSGKSLEESLSEAIGGAGGSGAIASNWINRTMLLPPDNSDTLFMNIFQHDQSGFFGDLTVYTKGYMQALLQSNVQSAMVPVVQKSPPAGQEYVHSIMYWLVVENHLMTIQSRSLTTKQLEVYLTWLLKDQARVIKNNGQVVLSAEFDLAAMGGDLDDVQEIIVGGTGVVNARPSLPVVSKAGDERPLVESRVEVEEKRSWGQRAVEVLRAVMGNEADVKQLLDNIPAGADLDVSVHIGYKSKKRGLSRAPMREALRNLPDGEITARGKFGRITGNDIRLSYKVNVLSEGSLLNPEDVRSKLRSAYDYFVDNGKIKVRN